MCLPRNPGAARVRGDCEKVYTAGGVLDEKQYVQPRLSNVSTQKVGDHNALCSGRQEWSPDGPLRRGAGSMPASLRIDHIVLANRVAKPSKFTVNAPVTQ